MIPVNKPKIFKKDILNVVNALKAGWISSGGPYISEFEYLFAKKFSFKYTATVSSGTAALDIAIEVLDLKENDEIIVPNFSIISTINQLIRKNLKPIFVDTDLFTWNMLDNFEQKISHKTKAIILTHIYGLSPNLEKIIKICKKYKLIIIEDTAEALGQKYNGRYCGSFGDISTFSFYANKNITTGEGGMISTKNKKYFKKILKLRNLSFDRKRFIHKELGWNYRMTSMQAAIGISQLKSLDFFLQKRIKIASIYNKKFSPYQHIITLPLREINNNKNSYWVYGILFKKKNIKASKIIKILKNEYAIETRPFFFPLSLQPVIKKYSINSYKTEYKNSLFLYNHGLYLPSGVGNSYSEINKTADSLIDILKKIHD